MKRAAVLILEKLGLPFVLILIWTIATIGAPIFYAPSPAVFFDTFVATWSGPRIATDILPSLSNLAVGLVLAIVIGVASGLLIGSLRWLRAMAEPVLEFFRAIPAPVLIPVLMLFLGVTDAMRIVVIVSGAIWPVLLNTVEGVRAIDPVLSETSRSYGIEKWARIRHLVVPSALPQIMTGVRQCLSIGLILMVISEMFAASAGLGFTIIQFQQSFAIPEMWSGIAVLGLLGLGLSIVFKVVERRILRWYHGQREVENAAR